MKKLVWTIIISSLFVLSSQVATLARDPKPPNKTPELLNQGKKLYEQNCTPCHGPKGDGKGPLAASLKPAPSDFAEPLKKWPNTKGDMQKIFEVISKGIPNSAMVKWDQFSEQERWGLVYVVMGLSTPEKKKK